MADTTNWRTNAPRVFADFTRARPNHSIDRPRALLVMAAGAFQRAAPVFQHLRVGGGEVDLPGIADARGDHVLQFAQLGQELEVVEIDS